MRSYKESLQKLFSQKGIFRKLQALKMAKNAHSKSGKKETEKTSEAFLLGQFFRVLKYVNFCLMF